MMKEEIQLHWQMNPRDNECEIKKIINPFQEGNVHVTASMGSPISLKNLAIDTIELTLILYKWRVKP